MTNTPQPANIFESAVCLSVSLSRLGTRRKVSSSKVEVEADKDMIHVTKDIIQSKELKDIVRVDGEIKAFLRNVALPSVFRGGVYLLPIALVEMTDAKLEEFRASRIEKVEVFLTSYPTLVEQAQQKLRDLSSPTDYPPVEVVRTTFGMDTQYLTFGVPGQLEAISKAIFKREQEKSAAKVQEQADQIVQVLTLSMKDLVDHMVDRLTPDADGKKKIFRDSLVKNMGEFLTTLKARNLTNDVKLDTLADQAKSLLDGVDPATLREADNIREYVRSGMEKIKEELDVMVTLRPSRKIVFEEDEEDEG